MSDEIQNAALYFTEEVAQPDGVTDEVSRAGEVVTDAGQVCEYEEQPFAAVSTPERQQLFWESVYQASRNIFLSMNCWAGILNWMAVIRKYQHPCSSFLMPRRNTVPVSCICRTG